MILWEVGECGRKVIYLLIYLIIDLFSIHLPYIHLNLLFC